MTRKIEAVSDKLVRNFVDVVPSEKKVYPRGYPKLKPWAANLGYLEAKNLWS